MQVVRDRECDRPTPQTPRSNRADLRKPRGPHSATMEAASGLNKPNLAQPARTLPSRSFSHRPRTSMERVAPATCASLSMLTPSRESYLCSGGVRIVFVPLPDKTANSHKIPANREADARIRTADPFITRVDRGWQPVHASPSRPCRQAKIGDSEGQRGAHGYITVFGWCSDVRAESGTARDIRLRALCAEHGDAWTKSRTSSSSTNRPSQGHCALPVCSRGVAASWWRRRSIQRCWEGIVAAPATSPRINVAARA